ncbi:MAG: ABC transporter substrate-binding protein [Pseudomonadota bacterium]
MESSKHKTSALVSSLVAGLLCLSAAGASAQTVKTAAPLLLGVIAPLTGPSADFGVPMLNGITLAVDEINAAGGYLGRPLQLIVKDDNANPDTGRKAAKELVDEKIIAAIAFCNSGVAAKSLDLFQDNKIPLIIPCATATGLTTKYPVAESYIFRTSAPDAVQSSFMVEEITQRGWTKVAIFADNTAYGENGLKDVLAALAAKKLSPIYVARFPLGVKNLKTELTEARAAGADVVFSYSLGPESVAIAEGRKELGWKVSQVGPWSLSFPAYVNVAKDAAEGTLMPQTFIVEQRGNERRAAFLNAYSRKYSLKTIPAPIPAAQAYDSTYLMLYGMFGVTGGGKLSGPAIKSSLENLKRVYYGAVATYDKPFSITDKEAISANMLLLGTVRNGAVTFAYLEDFRRNIFAQRK